MSGATAECPRCHGEGEVRMGGESLNPETGVRAHDPQCDHEERCPRCGGSGEIPIEQIGWSQADPDHAVVTVKGGRDSFRRSPCSQCPWRRENAGTFPARAFVISASTARDMSERTFGCHMSGTREPTTCAGALLSTGAEHNLQVRLRILNGGLRWEDVTDGGAELFPDYRSMAIANGVPPDHRCLKGLR